MEQLTGQAIEGLVRIARERSGGPVAIPPSAPPASAPPASLWKRNGPHDAAAESPRAESGVPAEHATRSGLEVPLVGIERRLARRAEALWDSLRGSARLPEASAAAALLGPPFSGHAMLVSLPPERSTNGKASTARSPRGPKMPRVTFVGEALGALAIVHPGPVEPDSSATAALEAQLAALAARAVSESAPVSFDSETSLASRSASCPDACRSAPLLMRAVALPLAAAGTVGPSVVIIVSWRALLSADETDALHRELAAAIDWMQAHRPHS